ncbi:MAG: hypothetical protein IJD65_05200 [Mailhella sp.]|nr:hypothetical protein [Mailhella sp.]
MPLLPSPCAVLTRQFLPIIAQCAASIHTHAVLDFGPAFLPEHTGTDIRRIGQQTQKGITEAGLSVSCFGLTLLAKESLASLLEAMHEASPYVLLADFKVAERNIEAPACLLMSGLRSLSLTNTGCFETYGGLEGLLYAERARFQPVERHSHLGGSLACVLARCL